MQTSDGNASFFNPSSFDNASTAASNRGYPASAHSNQTAQQQLPLINNIYNLSRHQLKFGHHHHNNNNNNNNKSITHESQHHSESGGHNQFVDKNLAFKYIRDHLANKHLENASRPNFNIAGIAPISSSDKVSNENIVIRNNGLTGSKISSTAFRGKHPVYENTKNEFASRKFTDSDDDPKCASKLRLPDIELSNKNRLSSLSNYLKGNPKTEGSNCPTAFSLTNPKDPNGSIVNNKSSSTTVSNDAELNRTIAAILPRSLLEKSHQPNFYFNYRQSGARIENLEKLKYSKSLKVNASAPKVWLKSKYSSSQKIDHDGFLVMQYMQ